MKQPSQMSRTGILIEGALMVSLGFVLSLIPFIQLPWGGTITFFSTLPVIVMSLRHSAKWGIATAFVFGFTQLILGLENIMYTKTLVTMLLCALLDYLLAYTAIGFTGTIAKRFKSPTVGLITGITATGLCRLFFSFLSGIFIWGEWAPEGVPVWFYSLTYNAGWCLPDLAVVLIAALLLSRFKSLHILPNKTTNTL